MDDFPMAREPGMAQNTSTTRQLVKGRMAGVRFPITFKLKYVNSNRVHTNLSNRRRKRKKEAHSRRQRFH